MNTKMMKEPYFIPKLIGAVLIIIPALVLVYPILVFRVALDITGIVNNFWNYETNTKHIPRKNKKPITKSGKTGLLMKLFRNAVTAQPKGSIWIQLEK